MIDIPAACTGCQLPDTLLREVRLRVPGKATEFQSKADFLCAACRKKNNGNYRLARRLFRI